MDEETMSPVDELEAIDPAEDEELLGDAMRPTSFCSEIKRYC